MNENQLTNYGEDMSGIIQLGDALKQNGSLTSLSCVALPPHPISYCQHPLTVRF